MLTPPNKQRIVQLLVIPQSGRMAEKISIANSIQFNSQGAELNLWPFKNKEKTGELKVNTHKGCGGCSSAEKVMAQPGI